MKNDAKEIIYVLLLTVMAAGLNQLFWPLPIIVILPVILTYTVDSPLVYLTTLAISAELFSSLPVGIMLLVVFLPWLLYNLFRHPQADINPMFAIITVLTITLQLCGLFLPDLYTHLSVAVIPWSKIFPTILVASSLTFLASVAIHYNRSW